MSEVLQEFFILFKAESKQLRESLDQVKKSTEDIQKRFKNVTEENKNFQLSLSGIARELLSLGAIFNSVSNLNSFSKGLQKTRQELALTSVQTGELASDINALESTFQYYGAPQGLVTASLPKIQDIIRERGDIVSSASPVTSLLRLSEIISKSGSLSGARIALQGLGLPPELATALFQSSFNQKFLQRQAQYGGVNGLTESQLAITKTQSDLRANLEQLYNSFVVPVEMKAFQSILDFFNNTLPTKIEPGSQGRIIDTDKLNPYLGTAFGVLGGVFSSLTDSSRSLLENLKDLALVLIGIRQLGVSITPLLLGFARFAGWIGFIGTLFFKLKEAADLVVSAFQDFANAGLKGIFDAIKFAFAHPVEAIKAMNGDTSIVKKTLQTDAALANSFYPSSSSSLASNNSVSVNVKGITINSLPNQNPEDIKNVVDNYFKKHVGNTIANYMTPVVI